MVIMASLSKLIFVFVYSLNNAPFWHFAHTLEGNTAKYQLEISLRPLDSFFDGYVKENDTYSMPEPSHNCIHANGQNLLNSTKKWSCPELLKV